VLIARVTWIAVAQVVVPLPVVPDSAAEPHAVGSPAQGRVRDHLVRQIEALGVDPVVQDATGAVSSRAGIYVSNLHNVLARLPGTASTGASRWWRIWGDVRPAKPRDGAVPDCSGVQSTLSGERELDGSGGSLTRLAVDLQLPAHEADELGGNGQTQPGPATRGAARR
jgi:hypothetical protein